MTLREFQRRVRDAFGPDMAHATPANVREFLDGIARERWREEKAARVAVAGVSDAPFEIPSDAATSYEEILRRFFAEALALPDEHALIQLWTFALDMAYAGLEEAQAQQMGSLFDDYD